MNTFFMNGHFWKVKFVDPYSPMLVDRTNSLTVATTDPETHCVYLSNNLYGDFLKTVLLHELGHCALFSFDLLSDIHRIEAEEWVCNFIADYGEKIFSLGYSILGYDAWHFVPYELDRMIA